MFAVCGEVRSINQNVERRGESTNVSARATVLTVCITALSESISSLILRTGEVLEFYGVLRSPKFGSFHYAYDCCRLLQPLTLSTPIAPRSLHEGLATMARIIGLHYTTSQGRRQKEMDGVRIRGIEGEK